MNSTLPRLVLFLSVLSVNPVSLAAQGEKARPAIFKVDAGEHALTELVDRAARFLGRNILFNPLELGSGRRQKQSLDVRLQHKLELDARGCEDFISQVAYNHNLILSAVDTQRQIYELIALRGQRRGEIRSQLMSPSQARNRRALRMMVQTVVQVKHIDAQRLAQTLRPVFLSNRGGIALQIAGVSESVLVLQGLAADVARATELIEMADLPPGKNLQSVFQKKIRSLEAQRSELLQENRELRKKLSTKKR